MKLGDFVVMPKKHLMLGEKQIPGVIVGYGDYWYDHRIPGWVSVLWTNGQVTDSCKLCLEVIKNDS